jgi:hypothetical protein
MKHTLRFATLFTLALLLAAGTLLSQGTQPVWASTIYLRGSVSLSHGTITPASYNQKLWIELPK